MKVYDNYEVSPCKRMLDSDAYPPEEYIEVCEEHEAQFWTLYGHIDGQGVQAIGDFRSREAAEQVYSRITGQPFTGSYQAGAHLRVMHAGPELLGALECLLDALGGLPITILSGPAYHALHKANAAIAKARAA